MGAKLKLTEVATRLNVSYWTVYRWVKTGKLKADILPSGGIRVDEDELKKNEG